MKRLILLAALFSVSIHVYGGTIVPLHENAEVAFSPRHGATELVVNAIHGAQHTILVQAYGFTSQPIITALLDAKDRGVDVEVILDKSNRQARYKGASLLRKHHIPVWIDDTVAIAHNKVMVIDDAGVITGSFNFTTNAEKSNAENTLYIHSQELAKVYADNWNWRKGVSKSK